MQTLCYRKALLSTTNKRHFIFSFYTYSFYKKAALQSFYIGKNTSFLPKAKTPERFHIREFQSPVYFNFKKYRKTSTTRITAATIHKMGLINNAETESTLWEDAASAGAGVAVA